MLLMPSYQWCQFLENKPESEASFLPHRFLESAQGAATPMKELLHMNNMKLRGGAHPQTCERCQRNSCKDVIQVSPHIL
eukprot:1178515-Amphidinium_carterae.1